MEKRLSYAYGRTLVISRIFTLAVVSVLIAVSVSLAPGFSAVSVAILGIVLAGCFVLFAVSPLLTEHWLTRSRLILRQGWYFRAVIALAEIEDVNAADDVGQARTPMGIHRPFGRPSLFVTGSRTNLVSLHLGSPRRFWQSFGLVATEIVFDVVDRAGFLAAIEERRGLLAPIKPDRPNAELRD